MKRSRKKVIPKRRPGRPATGRDPVYSIRLPEDLVAAVDKWASGVGKTRSEAIREFIERSFADLQPQRRRSTQSAADASKMAHRALDSLGDQSVPVEEQERRKRRLTKGPREFREMRDDLSKSKG